ncbi:MAG TPA: hypothetical protein VKE40_12630 [Gemmataceae bacterium]|nr:hypothetical protein [Gemmataceae bacterium]
MTHFFQLLNGYALLWAPALLAGMFAGLLFYRRARRRWWVAWIAGCGAAVAGLALLRTPDTSILQAAPADVREVQFLAGEGAEEWTAAGSIAGAVADSGGRSTLVEFYTDFGFS